MRWGPILYSVSQISLYRDYSLVWSEIVLLLSFQLPSAIKLSFKWKKFRFQWSILFSLFFLEGTEVVGGSQKGEKPQFDIQSSIPLFSWHDECSNFKTNFFTFSLSLALFWGFSGVWLLFHCFDIGFASLWMVVSRGMSAGVSHPFFYSSSREWSPRGPSVNPNMFRMCIGFPAVTPAFCEKTPRNSHALGQFNRAWKGFFSFFVVLFLARQLIVIHICLKKDFFKGL